MRQTQVLASGTAFTSPLSPTCTSKHPARLVSFLLVQLRFPFSWCFFLGQGPDASCYSSALLCWTLRSWLFYCLSLHCLLLSLPELDPLCLLWIHLYALHIPFSNLLLTLLKHSRDFLTAKFRDHTFSNMLHGLTCLSPGTPPPPPPV